MGTTFFLFVILLLHLFHSSQYGHGKETESLGFVRCKKHELEALLKFKQSFTNDPMNRLSSWVGEDCCQWHGVTCDNITHNVVKLNLRTMPSDNDYSDDDLDSIICMPAYDVSMVFSGVSPALLELKFLTYLDLSGNDFCGSHIPNFIGSLRHLRYLNLSSSNFFGLLPPQLGNLTNLVHLDLHDQCSESNDLHSEGFRWAYNLLKLQSLDMSGYNLFRAHDTFKVLITLPSLSALSLSGCELHNSHLSEAFTGNTSYSFFPTLQHLNLSSNAFEGPLSSVFKNMVSLRSLSLFNNKFNGSVPLWLRAMSHLEVLDVRGNDFSYVEGGIMGIMGNPCNFKHLDLSRNGVTQGDILGPFMGLSGCSAYELQYLALSYNMINGSLPSSLGQLTNLNYLYLSHNEMSGSLPSSLGQLTNLNLLDLSNNEMSGSLPSSMGKLTKLNHLYLSDNEFKGRIPTSFVNLSALTYLDLSNNKLSGLIPDFIGHITRIEHLDISSNSLHGTVFGIGNLSKLSYLDLSSNHLNLNFDSSLNWRPPFQLQCFNVHSCVINTVFPQWLRNQTQIQVLDLSDTGISGELPGWLWNSSSLKELSLSDNQLTGFLPQHIACDGHYSCNLGWLDLHNNSLTGTPQWLGHFQNAEVIDLSSNKLSGAIFDGNNASSLFNIGEGLSMLDLSDNMLSGQIQFKEVSPYAQLGFLGLRGNHFNGAIPSQLCKFESLVILELARNSLTGHIPLCLGSVGFNLGTDIIDLRKETDVQTDVIVKGISELSMETIGGQSIIDLSSNYLVGTIPMELTNISGLFALNLSFNHLTGHIPENIGNLKTVESLDLSNNHLSGTIPQSLSSISWLGKLNLSNNNLHGPIPTGSQLQTLDDPSIYAGNSGLCGFPLPNNCTELDAPPSSTNVNPTAGKDDVGKEDKYDKLWFILAVMSGVATGFWGVVGTLVIKRSWRQAYFRYVEDLGDRIYVPIKVRVNRFKRRFTESS